MLVKDIISLACDFTEHEEIATKIKNEQTLTEEETLVEESLVNCLNLVRDEIALSAVPLVMSKEVKTEDFKIEYSSLTGKVLDIVNVTDTKGRSVKYKKFDNYLLAFASNVIVTYKAQPEKLTYQSEFVSVLPERVYAYGVAREFYFLRSLFDDADIWQARFEDALNLLLGNKREIRLPRRRWI